MSSSSNFSDLKTRMISAAILTVIVLFSIWYGCYVMTLLMIGFFYLGMKEWMDLAKSKQFEGRAKQTWLGYGILYVGLPTVSILLIRFSEYFGFEAVLWLMSIVVATDIGAYFSGRILKGPKVAPSISPNKTWSGSIGGTIAAIFVSSFVLWMMDVEVYATTLKLALIFSIVSQAGDFFESHLKRKFGVKDTGSILPGHGGILDRFDGQMAVWVLAAIIGFMSGSMDDMAANLLVW